MHLKDYQVCATLYQITSRVSVCQTSVKAYTKGLELDPTNETCKCGLCLHCDNDLTSIVGLA
jgi:hypothetical protein